MILSKTAAVVLAFLCLALFPTASKAQLLPSGNVYGGVAYADSEDVVVRQTYRGWNASLEDLPLHRFSFLGAVLDGSGIYRKGVQQYNLVLGPRVSKNFGKWRLFADAMGGIQELRSSGQTFRGVAIDGGGGVDRKLPFKNFSWRFQFDYTYTHLLSAKQNDYRGSTGVVWRF
ncbi:MAG TPA: hypothetical protein VND65_01275 [Candidatus Binatia bacterium]|nr:hypothetical protein [Candidatus Binatia bacterium]